MRQNILKYLPILQDDLSEIQDVQIVFTSLLFLFPPLISFHRLRSNPLWDGFIPPMLSIEFSLNGVQHNLL